MPKIRDVVTDPDRPVLIEFQNGKVQPGEEQALQISQFIQRSSSMKVLGISNGDMTYSGPVTANEDYNTFLMVETAGSKKLKLIQVDTCTVAPLLRQSAPVTSPVKSLNDLRRHFGSKKAKRFTEQQERLKMNVENVKEQLEDTVAGIELPEMPARNPEREESLYRPKINRDASAKEDVYKLDDLVPAAVLHSLQQRVSEVLESEDMSEFGFISTVESYMKAIRSSGYPESTLLQRGAILLYVHYLVKFLVTPVKALTKKFVACDCSPEVDKHLRSNYTINGARPLTMKDKGLCYTLVLLMIAMDYELNLESVCKDIKIGLKKVQEFSRNLGFSSGKQKTSIVLKIPVPPPVMPHLKRQRPK